MSGEWLLEFADVDEQIEVERDPVVHFDESEHGFRGLYSECAHLERLLAAQLKAPWADHTRPGRYGLLFGAGADGNFYPCLNIEPVLAVAVEAFSILAGIYQCDADIGVLIGLEGLLHIVVDLPVVAIKTFDRDGEIDIFEAGVTAIAVDFQRLFLVLLIAVAGK